MPERKLSESGGACIIKGNEALEAQTNWAFMGKKNQTWTTYGWYGLLVVLLVVGGAWLVKNKPGNTDEVVTLTVDLYNGGDWVRGSPEAPLVVVEYSDFQCPACAAFEPLVQQAQTELGDQMLVVYREFPLTSIHDNAQLAAQAAEAAGLQGKFWEMHDLLFEQQATWSTTDDPTSLFVGYAESLNLEAALFESDLTSAAVKRAVATDVSSGNQLGVGGTPTFYVNGKKMGGVKNYTQFLAFIKAQLPTP